MLVQVGGVAPGGETLGVAVSVVNQIVTELENDFDSPDGLKAQQILSDEVISKLK